MSSEFIEGQALVASPYLMDRNFLRTVVYLIKHDEDGAYGVVLNRPMNVTVGNLLKQLLDEAVENEEPIFHGGPVEGPVVVVHERPTAEATLYQPGVYVSGDHDEFIGICQQSLSRYRVFSGYAGWGPGQLEDELRQGGWLVWPLSKEELFADPNAIWQNAVRQIGRQIITDSVNLSHLPTDPSVN